MRKDVAALKRRMAASETAIREIQTLLKRIEKALPASPPEQTSRAWISGKGIKSLRKRLGLSQAEFARLLGVSDQTVYKWERKSGMLEFRGVTKAKVLAVRGIGAREAKKRLAEMKQKAMKPRDPTSKRDKRGKPREDGRLVYLTWLTR